MDGQVIRVLFVGFLVAIAAIDGAQAETMVTGTVFCDHCKDGQISLFDYPLNGIKVAMTCLDTNGQLTLQREATTNWLGTYAMRFDGTPNLSGCQAQVSGPAQAPIPCGAVAGPPEKLNLMLSMFDMEMYSVNPLLSQPAQPMSTCPTSATPISAPVTPVTRRPPPIKRPPVAQLPPLPPFPPMPFVEATACPYWNWSMPEYKCYWKALDPSTKVAVPFGIIAARRYGTDITLWRAIQGKGDPYRTLLREATTALLNSYNSIQFQYHPLGVIQDFNLALMGSSRNVLHTALRFKRANSGNGKIGCKFTPCKSMVKRGWCIPH